MRRWSLTSLLVVLLALAGTTLGSPGAVGVTTFVPATQSVNLLKDPSFEDGGADWSLSAPAPAQATMFNEKPSGHVEQVVVTGDTPGEGWRSALRVGTATSSAFTISAGSKYVISFWARASSARPMDLVLQQDNAANNFPVLVRKTAQLTTAWKQFTFRYDATTTTTDVYLSFLLGEQKGSFWFDQAYVGVPTNNAAGSNLLTNGSFESGTAPWFVQTSGTTAQAAGIRRTLTQLPVHVAVTNTKSPRAADWEAAIQKQGLNLTAGQPLLISFQARAKRPTTVRWSVNKNADPWTEYQTNTAPVTSTWQSFTYRWTPTATTAGAASFSLHLGGESAATWKDNEYWIDDVTVAPIVNNQADTSLVFDSFESGPVVDCPAAATPTQPWTDGGGWTSNCKSGTTVKREYGAYWTTGKGESLRLDEAALGDAAQRVSVTTAGTVLLNSSTTALRAGKPLLISFFAKADAGQKVTAELVADGTVVKTQQFTLDGNWQYFQTSYTPAAAVTTARLRLNVGATVGEYLVDNAFLGERAAYSRGGNIQGPFQGVCCSPADSIWPTETDFQWYQSHGFNILRLPMLWEELQPTLPADPKTGTPVFDAAYLAKLDATVDLAYKYGIKVAPTFVNQGVRPMKQPVPAEAGLTWPGDYVFGTTKTPIEAYSKMWAALIAHIKASPNRYASIWAWDIVNEPYRNWDWITTHQPAVINAIRTADGSAGKPVIAMPVDEWTYGYPHDAMKPIKRSDGTLDPKVIYEAHVYFDNGRGASYRTPYARDAAYPTLGLERLTPFLDWAKAEGVPTTQLYLGEYGVPGGRCRADNTKAKVVGDWCSNNSSGRESAADLVTVAEQQQWSRVLDNMMGLMDQVGLTGTYWGVGPGADIHSVHADSIDDALEDGTPPVLVLDNHKGSGGLPGQ